MNNVVNFKDFMMDFTLKHSKVVDLNTFMRDSLENNKAEEQSKIIDRGENTDQVSDKKD